MVVESERFSTKGSAALKQERRFLGNEAIEKQRELERKIKEHKNRKNQILKASRGRVISYIILTFLFTFSLMFRYSYIYSIQSEFTKTQENAAANQRTNENLKIQLLKLNNEKEIHEKAAALGMIQPVRSSAVFVDFSKENFN